MALSEPIITVLGEDPGHRRKCILNGNAFQQDAVVSFLGWQYAVFYSYLSRPSTGAVLGGVDHELEAEPLYIHVGRRKLPDRESNIREVGESSDSSKNATGGWEILVLDDYPQTVDDGHNTVQMGICPGDGTIHLSFDHHCDV